MSESEQQRHEYAATGSIHRYLAQAADLYTEVGWREKTIESRVEAVERVILSMRQHLGGLLTLQDMAAISQLSPYHFSRVFSRITGVSPCRFLAALRLQEAKRLLLRTQLSATEVCFEVGYNSLGTFTTHFTQLVGISPARLRRSGGQPLAEAIAALEEHSAYAPPRPRHEPAIGGQVKISEAFVGLIFIGLFPAPIPQGQPAGCALLTRPGPYRIAPVADGSYWLFAAAFAHSSDPLAYLLPDRENHWIGVVNRRITVRDGHVSGDTTVTLRHRRLTDPPILSALPLLLSLPQPCRLLEREVGR